MKASQMARGWTTSKYQLHDEFDYSEHGSIVDSNWPASITRRRRQGSLLHDERACEVASRRVVGAKHFQLGASRSDGIGVIEHTCHEPDSIPAVCHRQRQYLVCFARRNENFSHVEKHVRNNDGPDDLVFCVAAGY